MENRELDLIELIRRLIVYLKKRIIIIIILIVAGIIGGALNYYLRQPVYRNSVIVSSPFANNMLISELIKPIVYHLNNKNLAEVAKKIKTDEGQAVYVCDIKVDTSYSKEIKVNIFVHDTANYMYFVQKLIDYLNSTSYMVTQIKAKQAVLNDYYTKLNEEIEELDKYQKAVLASIESGPKSNVTVNQITMSHQEMIFLLDKRTEILESLNSLKPVSIINTNRIFEPQLSLIRSLAIFIVVIFLLGFIVIVIVDTK